MTAPKFKIQVPDWTKINPANARFILGEAKEYFAYTASESGKITERAFAMLAILVPITSALLAFAVNERLRLAFHDSVLTYLLAAVVVALITLMFGLGTLVFPRRFMAPGREPKELCTDAFLVADYAPADHELALVLSEIEGIQAKIDFNDPQNARRGTWLKWLMRGLGALFIAVVVAVFLGLSASDVVAR